MDTTEPPLILVGDTSNFSLLKEYFSKYPSAKIFSLNYLSHQRLKKENISHEIGENILHENDFSEINNLAKNASITWHQNDEIKNFLEFQRINLGQLIEMEFYQYLLPLFLNALNIERILSLKNPKFVIFSTDLNEFVEEICDKKKIKFISIPKQQNTTLVLDNLNIKMNLGKLPISLKISRKNFLFFKNTAEKFIFLFLGIDEKEFDEKSILLVDFNPVIYEDLFNNLSKLNKKIFILNTRRPAVWNFQSFSIVSKNQCKIISLSMFEKQISEKIYSELKDYNIKLEKFLEQEHIFKNIFSFNSYSLWSSIKNSFKKICLNRFSESIKLILLISHLLSKINPSVILEWAETASEEKIILQIAKQCKINSVYLQHTMAAIEDSGRFHGRFISHLAHPFLSDKQAVWGMPAKEYALQNKNDAISVGSPRHDRFFNIENNFEQKGLILFAPTLPSNISSNNMTTEAIETFNKFIQETCKILKNIPNKKFIVKPHPTPSTIYDIAKLVKDVDPNIPITYEHDVLKLIEQSELLITTNNSTIAIDAMMLKKPVISLQTRPFYLSEELVKMDAVISVTELSNIELSIKRLLENRNEKISLLKKSKIFLDTHFENQGHASKNLATILDNFN